MKELEELLEASRIDIHIIDRIMGYLAAKPERWSYILLYRCNGMNNSEISALTGVSRQTICRVIRNIKKLGTM